MKELKRLVLFGSRMGLNFSGGSNATVMLFQHIVQAFSEVYVVAKEFGSLPFSRPYKTIHWTDEQHAIELLKDLNEKDCIFYGDFWDSIYMVKAHVPFFFTYHDNWPEQKHLDKKNWDLSFQMEAYYKEIFASAIHTFSVTQHKREYIGKSTQTHSLAYNGSCMKPSKFIANTYKGKGLFRILMVGNIDQRKYKLALGVFSTLKKESYTKIQVDIYGHNNSPSLFQQLSLFPFVKQAGFVENIDYTPYHLLLSCSQSENLPISMLESLINYTPVLSFDVGGISELVENNQDGKLVTPYDVKQMAYELEIMISGTYAFSFDRKKLDKFNWNHSAELMIRQFRASLNV